MRDIERDRLTWIHRRLGVYQYAGLAERVHARIRVRFDDRLYRGLNSVHRELALGIAVRMKAR